MKSKRKLWARDITIYPNKVVIFNYFTEKPKLIVGEFCPSKRTLQNLFDVLWMMKCVCHPYFLDDEGYTIYSFECGGHRK